LLTWPSIEIWLISLLSLAYLLSLFFIAYWGQRQKRNFWSNNPWIYSLSIGVSYTAWAFYGIVGQAAITGEWLAHIYIGTISCFIFGWPMLLKMLRISKQQNLTSIADFIACRYDKAPHIAALVTVIALLGTIPYIALQLRAISQSFDLVTSSYPSGMNTSLIVAIVLCVFSIIFGARHVRATEQNQGLVFAIAFSSILKLLAISAIGIFVTFLTFDGFTDLVQQHSKIPKVTTKSSSIYLSIAHVLLGFFTIFITPQLYHVMVIENKTEKQLKRARWIYPGYLILINIFVLPIALAGQILFPAGGVNADTYILTIPMFLQQQWLSIFVYIGGLAAATSMVIVAVIVLSTMFSTELLSPILIRNRSTNQNSKLQFADQLLNARRISIAGIMLLALLFERLVSQQSHLSSIGILSFVLLAQTAPAVIGAMYWRSANSVGAVVGLIVGSILWFYTLMIPAIWPQSEIIQQGLLSISWLKPTQLFGINFLDATSHGIFISLLANTLCFVFFSFNSNRSVGEKIQAEIFLKKQITALTYKLTPRDLYQVINRFINRESADEFLKIPSVGTTDAKASAEQIEFTHKKLASVLGTASTRLVMNAASSDSNFNVPLEDVAHIVDEANQLFKFNRELLQAGVENIDQGISVVDADMRLVAWNRSYIELLGYPNDLIKAGMPIAELIKYNVKRKLLLGDDLEEITQKRIDYMRAGNNHFFQRTLPSGIVLEIRGHAMPGGGFVSTFSDITQHIESEKALQQANENLEHKVNERTIELSNAKAEAEAANKSKTRFLAAASHDLMQPFNALALFTDMLKKQVKGTESEQTAGYIQDSLSVVEVLISDLVEISKLEATTQSVDCKPFCIMDVLEPLKNEFKILAQNHGIDFSCQMSSCWVNSDKRLLRRVIQNLLSNAIHYSPLGHSGKPRILLGVKRKNTSIQIQVWDNGPGIPENKRSLIFKEFERLKLNRDKPGLGLGLAISDKIAKLLKHPLNLASIDGKGSMFSIELDKISAAELSTNRFLQIHTNDEDSGKLFDVISQISILIIDNDELLLTALKQQISHWTKDVIAVKNREEWNDYYFHNHQKVPDIIISDYHLGNDDNGVLLAQEVQRQTNSKIPCVICSVDSSELVREHVSEAQFSFIKKPVKALALKKLIRQLLFSYHS
jgi:Na+/proline symporter/signal transduction histidine kinase